MEDRGERKRERQRRRVLVKLARQYILMIPYIDQLQLQVNTKLTRDTHLARQITLPSLRSCFKSNLNRRYSHHIVYFVAIVTVPECHVCATQCVCVRMCV